MANHSAEHIISDLEGRVVKELCALAQIPTEGTKTQLKRALITHFEDRPSDLLAALSLDVLREVCESTEWEDDDGALHHLDSDGDEDDLRRRIKIWCGQQFGWPEQTTATPSDLGGLSSIDDLASHNHIDPTRFFDLVNHVLEKLGRSPLAEGSSQQRIIEVKPDDRVLQILAGPGSGKTEMLVWRVLYELFVLGTPSAHIVVTTFTKKAATELTVRLVERADLLIQTGRDQGLQVVDPKIHDLRVGTIHSLCDQILAEFDDDYMAQGTTLIDEIETQVRFASCYRNKLGYNNPPEPPRVINRLSAHPKLVSLFTAPWSTDDRAPSSRMDVVAFINGLIGMQTETWFPRCGLETPHKPNGLEDATYPTLTEDLVLLQKRWEDYLNAHSVLDFTTLQKRFLERQSAIEFPVEHVFVDEFQDTNPVQYAIHLKWLERTGVKLTTVGDDDQSMYRFRGSDIDCFQQLEPHCRQKQIAYRMEVLEENWRSTKEIVNFSRAFKEHTVLKHISMPKKLASPSSAPQGDPVRLLSGEWSDICAYVAKDLARKKIGHRHTPSQETAAFLLFSTSQKGNRHGNAPADDVQLALEAQGLKVVNARNKMAAEKGSPVSDLLGLISYFVDPIELQPAGKNGRKSEVFASIRKSNDTETAHFASFSSTLPPSFPVSQAHAAFQKSFRKNGTRKSLKNVVLSPEKQEVIDYVDMIRQNLLAASQAGHKVRLTLAGFVARLLTFPYFRDVGFTYELFRQALFTELLEASITPTRTTSSSLDDPLKVKKVNGKVVWEKQVWSFLSLFGSLVDKLTLDDVEVESFSENAISLLTFHQSKGLEFDHIYVAATGRSANPHSVLRTKLFSGDFVDFTVQEAQPETQDVDVNNLACADRDREVFVALTRAKKTLTILHDPQHGHPLMGLNEGLESMFNTIQDVPTGHSQVTVKVYKS